MQDFKKLKVWEKSHQLALDVYQASKTFPKDEMYGLTGQLRRACISISANIAEGCGRGTRTEFNRFVQIASGSASEVECELLLARDLGYLSVDRYNQMNCDVLEVKKMLASLTKTLQAANHTLS